MFSVGHQFDGKRATRGLAVPHGKGTICGVSGLHYAESFPERNEDGFNPITPSFGQYRVLDKPSNYHHNVIVMLGEFEYLFLTAAARLGDDAYGVAIRQEIEAATRRSCSIGALYTTLDRLEAKGFVKTWMGDPTPQRGGRPKRMVRVTGKGAQEAAAFYNAVNRASRGVSWAVDPAEGPS